MSDPNPTIANTIATKIDSITNSIAFFSEQPSYTNNPHRLRIQALADRYDALCRNYLYPAFDEGGRLHPSHPGDDGEMVPLHNCLIRLEERFLNAYRLLPARYESGREVDEGRLEQECESIEGRVEALEGMFESGRMDGSVPGGGEGEGKKTMELPVRGKGGEVDMMRDLETRDEEEEKGKGRGEK